MLLPLLFMAGMCLIDALDGILMLGAYGWAFIKPIRKAYYNLSITLLSVLVAFVVGTYELLQILEVAVQRSKAGSGASWIACLSTIWATSSSARSSWLAGFSAVLQVQELRSSLKLWPGKRKPADPVDLPAFRTLGKASAICRH